MRPQVIARIFYCVNRSWSGRITVAELRRSNLLKTIQLLEQEEDINQVRLQARAGNGARRTAAGLGGAAFTAEGNDWGRGRQTPAA